jgi:hypothetical protein
MQLQQQLLLLLLHRLISRLPQTGNESGLLTEGVRVCEIVNCPRETPGREKGFLTLD